MYLFYSNVLHAWCVGEDVEVASLGEEEGHVDTTTLAAMVCDQVGFMAVWKERISVCSSVVSLKLPVGVVYEVLSEWCANLHFAGVVPREHQGTMGGLRP